MILFAVKSSCRRFFSNSLLFFFFFFIFIFVTSSFYPLNIRSFTTLHLFIFLNLFQYLKRSSATWYFSRSRSFTFVSRFIFLSISLSTLMIEINYIYTIEEGLYSLIIDYFKRKVTFFFFLISIKFGQVNRHNGRRYPYPRGNGRIVRNKLS